MPAVGYQSLIGCENEVTCDTYHPQKYMKLNNLQLIGWSIKAFSDILNLIQILDMKTMTSNDWSKKL